jgi:hypothetical protein
MKIIESFEIWCYKMEKMDCWTSWTDWITNEDILKRIYERKSLWKSIQKKRYELIGYILRHGELLGLILEEIIDGKIVEVDEYWNIFVR